MPTYCEVLLPFDCPVLFPPTKYLDKPAIFMAVEETGWQEEQE